MYYDKGDFKHYSQLVAVDPNTKTSEVLLTSFLGRNFLSVNDIRQHPITGDLWFTDADYRYFQNFRSQATQPKQVYCFKPKTGIIQVVANSFVKPNSLEFSPDLKTLYVSDTRSQQFTFNGTEPSTIYAFNIVGRKRLANKRTFAFVDSGFPDSVHYDTKGNV